MFATSVIAMILMLIGAINYGLVGFFNYNFLAWIFGSSATGDYTIITHVCFAIIGLAGLWGLSFLGRLNGLIGNSCKKDK